MKKFNKFICVLILVFFTCFSSFQLHKTYSKAVAPLLAIPFGVELLFNLAATAFVTNAVYQMGSEAKKIYDDWQNNKNDDEKKSQYTHWGNELKNSMTSEEVENALNSAVNVVDGAVGLTLSSKTYQEFIDNVNKDRQKVLSVTFSQGTNYYDLWQRGLSLGGYNATLAQQYINECNKNNYSYLLAYFYSPYGKHSFLLFTSNNNSSIFWNNEDTDATFSLNGGSFSAILYEYSNNSTELGSQGGISHGNSLSISSLWGKPVSNIGIVEYNAPSGFSNIENPSLTDSKEFETSQPDLEIQANPDYDSIVSVSIPTTEISPEQLTKSPYKENASSFEYPDNFEDVVNNTTINNEYNKNPIGENNDGLLDTGETVNIDFKPLYQGLSTKFPFCIPWDFKNQVLSFKSDEEVPSWDIEFNSDIFPGGGSFHIDLEPYNEFRLIFRYSVLVIFCISLMYGTRKLMGGD